MSVSVVIRTRDRPIFLQRAVKSVLAQTFADFEIIVVNDGGEPLDLAAANRSGTSVRIISAPVNLGRGAALATGIDAASGRFVAVHDDDDGWRPTFLEAMLAHHASVKTWWQGVVGVVCRMSRRVERLSGGAIETIREQPVPRVNRSKGLVNVSRYLSFQEDFIPIQAVFERAAALPYLALVRDMRLFEDRLLFSSMLAGQGDFAVLKDVLAFQSMRVDALDVGMNDTDGREIDFYFAALQNRLLRAGTAGSALSMAPFVHEMNKAQRAASRLKASSLIETLLKRPR